MLRKRAERAEASAECENHIGLVDQLHCGLGTLVSERASPLGMAGREAVVVQVGVADRATEAFG